MHLPIKLPETRDHDVVGFGTNAVDHLISVPRFPQHGSKVEMSEHRILPGGEAASTMFGLQRLGFRTAYAGSFGDDEAGRVGLASLQDAGVDVSFSRVVPGAETQSAFIFVDAETGERTIAWRRDDRLAFTEGDAPVRLVECGRILHITPHDTAACVKLAAAARAAGTVVSIDIDNVFDGVENLLPLVDVCITSEDLPRRLTGIPDVETALDAMRVKYGCPIIGATLGEKGSIVLAEGTVIRSPAFPVPRGCVDTTGAGDAFRTGFLFGLLEGSTLEGSAKAANAAAALKCRDLGARQALPTRDELQTMLKNV